MQNALHFDPVDTSDVMRWSGYVSTKRNWQVPIGSELNRCRHRGKRKMYPNPWCAQHSTDAIVVITEMMRFADLNAFDVNMWLGRRK